MSSERIFHEHSFSGLAGSSALVAHTFGRRDIATKRIVTAAAGEQPDGVIHDDFEAERAATLDMAGYPLRVVAGVGGVTADTIGMVGAGGTAVTWTAGNFRACRFHTTAAEGALVEIELLPRHSFVPLANIVALTDNSGGAADNTLEDCNNAVTGVDGVGSNAASKADVDARLVSIANNIADIAAKVNAIITALDAHKLTL